MLNLTVVLHLQTETESGLAKQLSNGFLWCRTAAEDSDPVYEPLRSLWAWKEFLQIGHWLGGARKAAKERSPSWGLHKDLNGTGGVGSKGKASHYGSNKGLEELVVIFLFHCSSVLFVPPVFPIPLLQSRDFSLGVSVHLPVISGSFG